MSMVEGRHGSRVWLVAGGLALAMAGYYGFRSSLFLRLHELVGGDDYRDTTALLMRFGLLALLGFPAAGLLSDRVLGLKKTMFAAGVLIVVGIVLGILRDPTALIAAATISAFGLSMLKATAFVYLGEGYPKLSTLRVGAFAIVLIAFNVAPMTSVLFTGFASSTFGPAIAIAVCALPAMASVAVFALSPPEEPIASTVAPRPLSPQVTALLIIAACLLLTNAVDAGISSFAMPSKSSGFSTGISYQLLFSANPIAVCLVGALAAIFWSGGARSGYSDAVSVGIAVGAGLFAVAVVAVAVVPGEDGPGMGAALGGHVIAGLGEVAILPLAWAAMTAAAPPRWKATAVGGVLLTGFGSYLPLRGLEEGTHARVGAVLAVLALGAAGLALAFMRRVEDGLQSAALGEEEARQGAPVAIASGPQPGDARTDLITGGIALAVGLVVTAGSIAGGGVGGRYVITTGLIVFGIVRLVRGLRRSG